MTSNITTNMAYRQYLTNNADTIIKNSQTAAAGNCSNIIPLSGEKMPSSPILFNSITDNPSVYDKPSDLKDNFLNKYVMSARQSTPGIQYYA